MLALLTMYEAATNNISPFQYVDTMHSTVLIYGAYFSRLVKMEQVTPVLNFCSCYMFGNYRTPRRELLVKFINFDTVI